MLDFNAVVAALDDLLSKAGHVGRLGAEHSLAQHVHTCAAAGDPKVQARKLMDATRKEWQRAQKIRDRARARLITALTALGGES